MNIFEAFKAIDEGKPVRRRGGVIIYFKLMSPHVKNERLYKLPDYSYKIGCLPLSDPYCVFDREDIEAKDWEIYERPSYT